MSKQWRTISIKILETCFSEFKSRISFFRSSITNLKPDKGYDLSLIPTFQSLTRLNLNKIRRRILLPEGLTVLKNLASLSLNKTILTDEQLLVFTNLKELCFECKSNSLHLLTNLESLELIGDSTINNEEECWKRLSKLTSLKV